MVADIIGHVVEKDNIHNKVLNGVSTPMLEVVLEDLAYVVIRHSVNNIF